MATKRIQDLENAEELLNDMLIPVAGLNKTQSAQLSQLRTFLNKYLVELNNQNFNDLTDDGFYQCGGTSQNAPVGQAVTWVVSVVKDGTIIVQTAYSTDATTSGGAYPNTYRRRYNGSSWSTWQLIAGNLDFAKTDLSNVSSNIDYVVESYHDGYNWYEIYKSGKINQGGTAQVSPAPSTIKLLKSFTTTNYSVFFGDLSKDKSGINYFGIASSEKTLSEFIAFSNSGSSAAAFWMAIGY